MIRKIPIGLQIVRIQEFKTNGVDMGRNESMFESYKLIKIRNE